MHSVLPLATDDPSSLPKSKSPNLGLMSVGPNVMTFDTSRDRGNWPRIHIRGIRRCLAMRKASLSVSFTFMKYDRRDIWSEPFHLRAPDRNVF